MGRFEKRIADMVRDTEKAVDIKVGLTYRKGTNEVKRLVYEVSVDGKLWEKRVFRNR